MAFLSVFGEERFLKRRKERKTSLRLRGIGFIVVGLVLAVLVGIVSSNMVARATGDTPVVVAAAPIPAYTQIKPEDVKVVSLPANSVTEESARELEHVVGRFTKTMIVEGSQITKEHVSLGEQNDFASFMTSFENPGIRAFALPSENPMIREISPGNRIDLYTVLETEEGRESLLIAEQVTVLGIANPEDPQGLILALTQDEINAILPVMEQVQISLVPYNVTVKGEDGKPKDADPETVDETGQKEDGV